nr:Fanconi anemia group D2 protein [Polyrhizophydium stewartii]
MIGDSAQSAFVFGTRLQARLKGMSPADRDAFLDDLGSQMDSPETLAALLGETTLARMLLGIDSLQPFVVQRLLEKLAEFTAHDITNTGANVPKMIIKQLCWLDYIVDSGAMLEKLVEVLQIASHEVQIELVGSIPEMVVDSEHQRASLYLIDLMTQVPDLTRAVLDTLTSLSMDEDALAAVRERCIDKLESADLDTLPVVIRFLLHLVSPESAPGAIRRIRMRLSMDAIANVLRMEAKEVEVGRSKGKKPERQPQALILESIRTSLQTRPFLQDAWLRAISDIETPSMFRPLDMLVVIVVYSLSMSHRKKAQAVVKKKALTGDLTPALIRRTLADHGASIPGQVTQTAAPPPSAASSYFNSILGLADFMLSTALESCHDLCIEVYAGLFRASDVVGRQQVIASLATHIGTGIDFNITVSLNVLLDLSRNEPENVTPFSIFIKSILDHLDKLSMSSVRKFFEVLSNLAVLSDNESFDPSAGAQVVSYESSILTDLHIVIRKQLGGSDRKYKQIGVLGAVVLIQKLAERGKMTPHTRKQSQQIFEMAACICIAFDEIAFAVSQGKLDAAFVKWLRKRVIGSFLSLFVLEEAEAVEVVGHVRAAAEDLPRLVAAPAKWMDIDNCDGCVQLYPLSLRAIGDVAAHMPQPAPEGDVFQLARDASVLAVLCSEFKLLQACDAAMPAPPDDTLQLLLFAGLLLFARQDVAEINVEFDAAARHAMCTALFAAINWCVHLLREVLNYHSARADDQTGPLCLARVSHILELEQYLQSILNALPGWLPPSMAEDASAGALDGASAATGSGAAGGTRATVVVPSSAVLFVEDDPQMLDNPPATPWDTPEPKPRKGGRGAKAPAKARTAPLLWEMRELRPLMRELELDVFSLLVVAAEGEGEGERNGLGIGELEFLLSDLAIKVDVHFGPKQRTAARRALLGRADVELVSRLTAREVFSRLVVVMPGVCKALETVANGLQELMTDADSVIGVVDLPLLGMFETIMRVVASLLRWPALADSAMRDDRINFLEVLASRSVLLQSDARRSGGGDGGDAGGDAPRQEQLVAGAFDYMARFEKCLVTAEAAAGLQTVLTALQTLGPASEGMHTRLRFFSKSFVSRSWRDASTLKSETLMFLIQQHISMAADPLQVIEDYVTRAFDALAERDAAVLEEYPLLTRSTFLSFYKAAFGGLCQVAGQFSADGGAEGGAAALATISQLTTCFTTAVGHVRRFEQAALKSVLLKQSRAFLQAFIKRVLPVLTREFKRAREDIIKMLRRVQTGTRLLQSVCSESKTARDAALAACVPPMRKTLETFLYEVKRLLADNNSLQAFSIGNLKHRAITGEVISSQIPNVVGADEDGGGSDGSAGGAGDGRGDGVSDGEQERERERERASAKRGKQAKGKSAGSGSGVVASARSSGAKRASGAAARKPAAGAAAAAAVLSDAEMPVEYRGKSGRMFTSTRGGQFKPAEVLRKRRAVHRPGPLPTAAESDAGGGDDGDGGGDGGKGGEEEEPEVVDSDSADEGEPRGGRKRQRRAGDGSDLDLVGGGGGGGGDVDGGDDASHASDASDSGEMAGSPDLEPAPEPSSSGGASSSPASASIVSAGAAATQAAQPPAGAAGAVVAGVQRGLSLSQAAATAASSAGTSAGVWPPQLPARSGLGPRASGGGSRGGGGGGRGRRIAGDSGDDIEDSDDAGEAVGTDGSDEEGADSSDTDLDGFIASDGSDVEMGADDPLLDDGSASDRGPATEGGRRGMKGGE